MAGWLESYDHMIIRSDQVGLVLLRLFYDSMFLYLRKGRKCQQHYIDTPWQRRFMSKVIAAFG